MNAIATPTRDVRKLRFSPNASHPSPAPSPYTPFSGRRSGSAPPGTPQLAPAADRSTSMPNLPLDSAEVYINGGLDEALRASSLDIVSAVRGRYSEADYEAALAFVSEMLVSVQAQLEMSAEFVESRNLHPVIRKEIRSLHEELRVEFSSWKLVETAWRSEEIRSRDLCTRRLSPDLLDSNCVLQIGGYVKCQRIVEWLEKTADEELERSGGAKVKPLDDPAYRWEYTAGRNDFESVSMDFPQLGGSLDDVEQKAEERLSMEIYRLVRAGRLEEAEEICRRVGQPWRAAALGGGKRSTALSANGIKGHARKTWRMAASAMAKSVNPGIGVYERAVYGLLSGILEPVLAVPGSFEDQAWARLTCLLDSTAERVLNGGSIEVVKIEDVAILQAFVECKYASGGMESISGDLMKGIRMARAYIGMGPTISVQHISDLLETAARLAQNGARQGKEWVCRFAAHLCLFLKFTGLLAELVEKPAVMKNFDTVIEEYVKLVIRKDHDEEEQANKQGSILPARDLVYSLSAKYLAELTSSKRIIDTYSQLLCASLKADLFHERAEAKRVGVSHRDVDVRRTLCLQKAAQCFAREDLNRLVVAATDLVWETALPDENPAGISTLDIGFHISGLEDVSNSDEMAVRAIEFLIFPAFANYVEALLRVTKVARSFFLRGKLAAARFLISWFPSDIISQIPEGSCLGAVHELDSWKMYMEAVSEHNSWNVYYTSRRPNPISEKVRAHAAAKPGEISYERQANANIQLERYMKEHEEFCKVSKELRDAAIESLQCTLLFEGGWMSRAEVDNDQDAEMEEDGALPRRQEIQAVRDIAVPQLAMLLHHVLHESGMHSEAISLAITIASEDHKLYKCFGQSELNAFLRRIADSTVLYAEGRIRSGETERPYKDTFFEEIAKEDKTSGE